MMELFTAYPLMMSIIFSVVIVSILFFGFRFGINLGSFSKKDLNNEVLMKTKAYEAFTASVEKQNKELLIMQEMLTKSLKEGEAIINEQLKKLAELKKSLPIHYAPQKVDAKKQQNQVDVQAQLEKIKVMFVNYPQLPTDLDLSMQEISAIQKAREEHHHQVYMMLNAYSQNRAKQLSSSSSSNTEKSNKQRLM